MKRIVPAHTQRSTEEWATPQELFDSLDAEFHFTLDPCASEGNAKCSQYFTKNQDGLAQKWTGVVFMNPPFRYCDRWVKKAYEECGRGVTVVCLLPSRTDTAWWHEYATKAEIRWIRGRVKYGGRGVNAPFASCILIFRPALLADWEGP